MVSIIIPTYNRSDQLNRTLQSLLLLQTAKELFEIIIIDNGSIDNTLFVINKIQEENKSLNIKYFVDAEPGLLTGRHRGVIEATGEILTFIDDDVRVSFTWLDTIIEVMNNKPEITFLSGPNLPLFETYPPYWLQYFWDREMDGMKCAWLSLLDFGDKPKEINPNLIWGLNFTIRKKDLEELKGFHPDSIPAKYQMFQGDGETGLTIKGELKGKRALYHPNVMLYHEVPTSRMTFEYFDRRAYYQGICDSYSSIRKKYGLYHEIEHYKVNKFSWNRYIRYLRKMFQKEFFHKGSVIPKEIVLLKKRFAFKFQEGFEFHQDYFHNNEDVKKWVLKEDYFNYRIPEL